MITMLQGVIKLNGVGGFYHIWSMWDDNVADSVNVISQEDIVMLHGKIKLKGVGLVKMEDRWWYGIARL
jgi:hypothetical protein